MSILILTELPPSANHSHIHTRSGLTFPSKKTKDFRTMVAKEAAINKLECYREGWLSLTMFVSFGMFKNGNHKTGDANNLIKQTEDALNDVAWDDDSQVIETHVYRVFTPLPILEIHIKHLPDERTRSIPASAKTIRRKGTAARS